MRELLRSHEEDIVNQVVLRLQTQNPAASRNSIPNSQQINPQTSPALQRNLPVADLTLVRIAELEQQLSQLRAQRESGAGRISTHQSRLPKWQLPSGSYVRSMLHLRVHISLLKIGVSVPHIPW